MSKLCIYCGAELDDDCVFCDECGKKQDEQEKQRLEEQEREKQEKAAQEELDVYKRQPPAPCHRGIEQRTAPRPPA